MRTTVLLPVDLHAALKTIAEHDRRSMHQEIIHVLEQFAAGRSEPPTTLLTSPGASDSALMTHPTSGPDLSAFGLPDAEEPKTSK